MKIPSKDSLSTREHLVCVAEVLFAEKGIDNVSLADIGRSAGQKNRNALQYHFGDKAGLINAVLDKHTAGIGARRRDMLAGLPPTQPGLRDVINILVLPVAEKLADGPSGEAFIQINAQLMVSRLHARTRRARVASMAEVKQLEKLLAASARVDGRASLQARMLIMDSMLFSSLASYLSLAPRLRAAVFVESLIDSICGVLSMPAGG